jgi:hypothetical protein
MRQREENPMTDKRTAAPATTEAPATPGTQYMVLHSAVGRFWQGQTVTAADLAAPRDALDAREIERLVDLGALAVAGSRQAQDLLDRLGADHRTPTGDLASDPEAVRRQVAEVYASLGRPLPTG